MKQLVEKLNKMNVRPFKRKVVQNSTHRPTKKTSTSDNVIVSSNSSFNQNDVATGSLYETLLGHSLLQQSAYSEGWDGKCSNNEPSEGWYGWKSSDSYSSSSCSSSSSSSDYSSSSSSDSSW